MATCAICHTLMLSKVSAEKHIQLHLDKMRYTIWSINCIIFYILFFLTSQLQGLDFCGLCFEEVQSIEFRDHVAAHCVDLNQPL